MNSPWKEKNLYKRILDRQTNLEKVRTNWDPATKIVAELLRPDVPIDRDDRGAFIMSPSLYNGRPAQAGIVMTRGLLTNLISPSVDWRRFTIPARNGFLRRNPRVVRWLQQADECMAEAYLRSNYYERAYDVMHDGVTVCSAVMVMEEDTESDEINFWNPHYQNRWLAQDHRDEDVVLHIMHKKTAFQIEEEFGRENLPQAMIHDLDNGEHWKEHDILQVFYRRDDPILKNLPGENDIPNQAWVCVWCLRVTDAQHETPLKIGWYRSKPFMVFHYFKPPGWTYSIGPGWMGMADILRSQDLTRLYMMGTQMAVDPPLAGLDSMINRVEMWPGGRTGLTTDEWSRTQGKPVHSMNPEVDFTAALALHERIDAQIDRWFNVDIFMQMSNLASIGKIPELATVAIQMMGEKNAILMPTVEKIERRFLKSVDRRVFEIEWNAGRMPSDIVPPELLELGLRPEPEFVGALAQQQMIYMSLKRAANTAAAIAPWLEFNEQGRYKIDVPKVIGHIAQDMGFYADCVVGDNDFDKMMEDMQAEKQQQGLIQAGPAIAQTIAGLQKRTEAGSPLAAITGRA